MNAPLDNVRAVLAGLAEEVEPVDLLDRTLATSRRLRLRRALATSAAVVATIAAASGVALATQRGPDRGPEPIGPASRPAVTAAPSRPVPTTPAPPSATTRPEPEPTTTTTSPTTSVEIPPSAMLKSRDAGSGYTASDDIRPGDHGSLFFLLNFCRYQSSAWIAKDDHVLAQRGRGLNRDDDRYVLQEATRYDSGWATRVIAELRLALRGPCRTVEIGGPADTSTLTIVASNFAGDGSLLVRDVRTAPNGTSTQYHVAVRQGDVYTHARIHIAGATQETALDIGRQAAQRLCAATTC